MSGLVHPQNDPKKWSHGIVRFGEDIHQLGVPKHPQKHVVKTVI